jgi:hypothetical protein
MPSWIGSSRLVFTDSFDSAATWRYRPSMGNKSCFGYLTGTVLLLAIAAAALAASGCERKAAPQKSAKTAPSDTPAIDAGVLGAALTTAAPGYQDGDDPILRKRPAATK